MAEKDGVPVAVFHEESPEINGGVSEAGDGERNVFYYYRRSRLSHRSHGRKEPFPDIPEFLVFGGNARELKRTDFREIVECPGDDPDMVRKAGGIWSACLDQKRRDAFAQSGEVFRHPFLPFHGTERLPVHQLYGIHAACLQDGDGSAGGFDIRKNDQSACLAWEIGDGVVRDFGDKSQRPFRTDHEALQDVDGIIEIHKGIEAVPGGILHLVLEANP